MTRRPTPAPRRRRAATFALLAVVATPLSACSGDDADGGDARDRSGERSDGPATEQSTPTNPPASEHQLAAALPDEIALPGDVTFDSAPGTPLEEPDDLYAGTCLEPLDTAVRGHGEPVAEAGYQYFGGMADQQQRVEATNIRSADADELVADLEQLSEAVSACDELVTAVDDDGAYYNVILASHDDVEVEGADQTVSFTLDGTLAVGEVDTVVLDVESRYVIARVGDLTSSIVVTEIGEPIGLAEQVGTLAADQLEQLVDITT